MLNLPEYRRPSVTRLAGWIRTPLGNQRFITPTAQWLGKQADSSFHAVVTDPPYTLHEYSEEQQAKRGQGETCRIPPAFDGHVRAACRDWRTTSWRASVPLLPMGPNSLAQACSGSESGLNPLVPKASAGERQSRQDAGARSLARSVAVMPRSMWKPELICLGVTSGIDRRLDALERTFGDSNVRAHPATSEFGA